MYCPSAFPFTCWDHKRANHDHHPTGITFKNSYKENIVILGHLAIAGKEFGQGHPSSSSLDWATQDPYFMHVSIVNIHISVMREQRVPSNRSALATNNAYMAAIIVGLGFVVIHERN